MSVTADGFAVRRSQTASPSVDGPGDSLREAFILASRGFLPSSKDLDSRGLLRRSSLRSLQSLASLAKFTLPLEVGFARRFRFILPADFPRRGEPARHRVSI